MQKLSPPPAWPGIDAKAESGFVEWRTKNEAVEFSEIASRGRVLIASNTGLHGAVMSLDSTLATALRVRGAQVHYTLCDGILPGCLMATISDSLPSEAIVGRTLRNTHCKGCFNRGTSVLRGTGSMEHRLSAYLTPSDYEFAERWSAQYGVDQVGSLQLDGVPVGEHALAGALRFFASGDLDNEADALGVVHRYLEGAVLLARAFDRLLEELQPEVVVLHHGIYSPQGVAAKVAEKKGVRVVTWVVSYRKGTFIFSHDDTYHHTLMDEPTETWRSLSLREDQRDQLHSYLTSRAGGKEDWIYFHKDPDSSFNQYAQKHKLDLSKPLISLLTNVMWDAQLHYPQNAFESMKEWILDSIALFAKRPDLQGAIRIHPAEVRGAIPARQTLAAEIQKAFPQLPPNLHVIEPLDEVSTYDLAAASNAIIIFGTKMGVELTPLGKPVIVAGEAWIRNKGLTIDVTSREQYQEIFNKLPLDSEEHVADAQEAEKYAYHFFFRRMIPLPFISPSNTSSFFDIGLESAAELAEGQWPGLDVICAGILEGKPFVYPAETLDH
ncbi:MAG: capsule biosynthesis protein [Pseudomonadota bacterium]